MPQGLRGRDGHLSELTGWLTAGPVEGPRLVLLEGEAGIGKTALATALADQARSHGLSALWSTAPEDAGVPPYWVWQQVTGIEPGGERYAYFQRLVDRLSGDFLVVIDDIQWADEPSLLALRHLLRQPVRCRLLVCATRRTGEAATGWEHLGPEILAGPDVRRIHLDGLDDAAAADLLIESAARTVTPELVRRATTDSGGNPLYLRELGRLIASGADGHGRDLRELIDARLRRLGGAAQHLLTAASVLAEEWELPVVARLIDTPTASCLAGVDEAIASGLLRSCGQGRFRFSHGLVRTVLAGGIPLQQAVALHTRAAEAIEDLHRDNLEAVLADIARHWSAVVVTGERRPAVEWGRRAAEKAMRGAAYEEAERLYTLALDSGATALAGPERAELLVARAAAAYRSGQLEAAFEDGRRAVALARDAGRPDIVGQAALCLDAIGDRRWDRSVREWCLEALEAGPEAPIRARLLARQAEACVYGGDAGEGMARAVEALDVAEAAGDGEALVAALRARQLTLSAPHHTGDRVALAQRMTGLGGRMRRPDVEMWGRLWAIDAMWEDGDLAGISTEISRLRWCVGEVGTPISRWHLLVARAALCQARAEFDEALLLGRQGFELMQSMGHPAAVGAFMSLAGSVGHHRGHEPLTTEAAPPGAQTDTGEVRNEIFAYIGPAVGLADVGRIDEAVEAYRRPGPPQSWQIPPYFLVQALQAGAHIAVTARLLDDVAWFRDRLEPLRGKHVSGGAGSASYMGPVELILGRCAAALGRLDEAEAELDLAVRICARVGAPGFEVEASVERAGVLRCQRQGRAARDLLRRVRPTAVRLGMEPWVGRIDAGLSVAEDRLSAREREVAGLVAQGRSNRDIAAALFVSERTAANHVQHILTKLGFSNRSQIAAWVAADE